LRGQCVSTEQVASEEDAAVAVLIQRAALLHRVSGGDLLTCFAAISDPRARRGVRHRLATILGLCTAAVLTGQKTLIEITEWISAADQELLAALGAGRDAEGRYVPPHPDTVKRVFTALGAQGLADEMGAYLARKAGIGCVSFPIPRPGVATGDRGGR
jgi:DDE_Tnp_1-associated